MKEVNCAVLGDEESCQCSALEEVNKQDAILSYRDKYIGNDASKGMANTARNIPAHIEEDTAQEIKRLAALSFQTLEARGVSRIDFILNVDTDDIYVNEINTIPGSLSFYLWEASGISFPELCDQLIILAKKAARREQKQIHSYSTNILSNQRGMKLRK